MAVDVSELKNKVAQQAQNGIQTGKAPKTIDQMIEQYKPLIAKALGKNMDPERFTRIALSTIKGNDRLKQCSAVSLMACIMQCAQLNLEPGILGHSYLVPYFNGKTKQYEAQFQIGYKGMLALARRSGEIKSIRVHSVCENDEFELEWGLEEKLVHKPLLKGDRGKPWLYYLVAEFTNGGHYSHVMTMDDIALHRARSKAATKEGSPWDTDFEAMCIKTVIRAAWKMLPISTDIQRQVEATDETIKHTVAEDMTEVESDAIDVEYSTETEETGATE